MNANILFRYIHELSDAAEREMVVAWLQESEKNREILAALVQRKMQLEGAANTNDAANTWQRVQTSMQETPAEKNNAAWWRYSAAAALAALVLGMTWLSQHKTPAKTPQLVKLATGDKQKKMITLPDGSKVWLQYNSSLEYDAAVFSAAERKVILNGEAFFNIAGTPDKPFRITAGRTAVTVLGTSFNVRARENTPQEIAVATGKINVQADQMNIILLPMQRVIYDPVTRTTTTDSTSLDHITAVRDNLLVFENDDLPSIARKLEHWYNRKIIIRGTPHRVSFTGSMQDNGIQKVLEGLSFLAGVQYQIKEDSIILSLKNL